MSAKYLTDLANSADTPSEVQSICCPRILVLEEVYDLRQITAEVLIDEGYRVDVAEDGQAAWSALQLYQYTLLITDQFIPKVSGLDLLKKIHTAHMALPIIMATRCLPVQEFARHPFLKSVNVLFKPYSFEKLLSMVEVVLPIPGSTSVDFPVTAPARTGIDSPAATLMI